MRAGSAFQIFQQNTLQNNYHHYAIGWIFGERFDWNLADHFSLEGSLQLGHDSMRLTPWGGAATSGPSVSTFNTQLSADLLYNFQPRTAKTNFFILLGPQWLWYNAHGQLTPAPSGSLLAVPVGPSVYIEPSSPLQRKQEPGYKYGIGARHYFNSRYGVRFDADLRINKEAHYGLPNVPNGSAAFSFRKAAWTARSW